MSIKVFSIAFQKRAINTDRFYVILLVKDKDRDCLVHKGDINPFQRDSDTQIHVKSGLHFNNAFKKSCKFHSFICKPLQVLF